MTVSPAYVAGFLDGEGCVAIYKYANRSSYYYRVRFTNSNRKALELIQYQYGGYIQSAVTTKGDNVIHRLNIQNKDLVKKVCEDVKDYVVIKKDQVNMMLSCLKGETTPEHAGWRLKGMKKVDHVQNLDSLGLDYLETVQSHRREKGCAAWDLDLTTDDLNSTKCLTLNT